MTEPRGDGDATLWRNAIEERGKRLLPLTVPREQTGAAEDCTGIKPELPSFKTVFVKMQAA